MQKTIFAVAFTFLALCFFNCNNSRKHTDKQTNSQSIQQVANGKISIVSCSKDPNQKYALFLPHKYDKTKKMPVIIAFDAHARGQKPVELLQTFADSLGYIVVGSCNAKNESKDFSYIIETLFDDIFSNYSIDAERIYTTGFSGGARVASSIALNSDQICGVISCAAGLPTINQLPTHKFHYLAIVGNRDFNYLEIRKTDKRLEAMGASHFLIVYDGEHEWPPSPIMNDALLWLEFRAISDGKTPRNDSLIEKSYSKFVEKLDFYQTSDSVLEAYRQCKRIISYFKGLKDITEIEKKAGVLATNQAIKQMLAAETKIEAQEDNMQQTYNQKFTESSTQWWKNEVSLLSEKSVLANNIGEQLSARRLINYLSMIAYMYANNSLRNSKFIDTEHHLEIYELLTPTNPDMLYFKAALEVQKGNYTQAVQLLNKAIDNGFQDIEKFKTDPLFQKLNATTGYQEILSRLEQR